MERQEIRNREGTSERKSRLRARQSALFGTRRVPGVAKGKLQKEKERKREERQPARSGLITRGSLTRSKSVHGATRSNEQIEIHTAVRLIRTNAGENVAASRVREREKCAGFREEELGAES